MRGGGERREEPPLNFSRNSVGVFMKLEVSCSENGEALEGSEREGERERERVGERYVRAREIER